jgi:uncharacterized protein with PIN domain
MWLMGLCCEGHPSGRSTDPPSVGPLGGVVELMPMFSRTSKSPPNEPPTTACPDCGGERAVVDAFSEMDLRRNGRLASRVKASVCLGCGRVYFYATDLTRLNELYGNRPGECR